MKQYFQQFLPKSVEGEEEEEEFGGNDDSLDNEEAPHSWIKLEVLNSKMNGDKGEVSFKAHYAINHQPQILSEHSFFERINGEWKYVDGGTLK